MELVKATKELTTETQSWPDRARAIQVTTGGQYAAVAQMLVGIKTLRNQVDQVIGPVVRDAHTAHKSALALKKAADDPLDEAERILKERMVDYRRRQDAQDQAERLRLEAEAKRVAKAQGMEAPAVIMPSTVPPVAGVSASSTWKIEVVDEAAMIKAAVRQTALRPLLKVDRGALRKYVVALKGAVKIPGVKVVESETIAVRAPVICAVVMS